MNDLALNIIVSATSGIVGTILGFLFGEFATKQREGRQRKEQKEAVCTLLHLEISQNLAWLDDFWRNKIEHNLEGLADEIAFQRRIHLIQGPLPAWSHLMWESQAAALSLALSEEELKAVFHFHAQLERLTTLRSSLSEALPSIILEQYNVWRAYSLEDRKQLNQWFIPIPPGGKHPYACAPLLDLYLKQFNDETASLWAECEGIRTELRTRDNPLPAPTPASASPKLFTRLKGRLPGKLQHKQP